jgi:predicted nucleic acid-binding protein
VILVDTSVIVAWLDVAHPDHAACTQALEFWAGEERLGVSSITYAELAAGGRTREAVEEDLAGFERLDLDFESGWRAGLAFGRAGSKRDDAKPVLPDFLIRGQASALDCRHLTNDRRRCSWFPEVEFLFPDEAEGMRDEGMKR